MEDLGGQGGGRSGCPLEGTSVGSELGPLAAWPQLIVALCVVLPAQLYQPLSTWVSLLGSGQR